MCGKHAVHFGGTCHMLVRKFVQQNKRKQKNNKNNRDCGWQLFLFFIFAALQYIMTLFYKRAFCGYNKSTAQKKEGEEERHIRRGGMRHKDSDSDSNRQRNERWGQEIYGSGQVPSFVLRHVLRYTRSKVEWSWRRCNNPSCHPQRGSGNSRSNSYSNNNRRGRKKGAKAGKKLHQELFDRWRVYSKVLFHFLFFSEHKLQNKSCEM